MFCAHLRRQHAVTLGHMPPVHSTTDAVVPMPGAGISGIRAPGTSHDRNARNVGVVLDWFSPIPRYSGSIAATPAPRFGPSFSITHSAWVAAVASDISLLVGRPSCTNPSRTYVAQIARIWAASQIHRISCWISAARSNPISTARSPRAINTARG